MKRFLMLALLFMGCSSAQVVTCPLESEFNNSFSSGFATTFDCTNPSAIIADMQTLEAGLNLCPAPNSAGKVKGIYGDLCSAVADGFIQNYLATKIPAKYGCTPTAAVSTAIAWVNSECQKLGRVRPKVAMISAPVTAKVVHHVKPKFERPTAKNSPEAKKTKKVVQIMKMHNAPETREVY